MSARWAASLGDVELLERGERDRLLLVRPQLEQRARSRDVRCSRPISTLVSTSSRPTRLNCWKIIAQSARQSRSRRPRKPRHVLAVDQDAAGARLGQAVDHAQQRRLAGTRPADDADEAAGRNLQRNIGDREGRAIALRQAVQDQHTILRRTMSCRASSSHALRQTRDGARPSEFARMPKICRRPSGGCRRAVMRPWQASGPFVTRARLTCLP